MVESPIFEIFDGLPRQGPGNNKCTEKAFNLLSPLPAGTKILDIGCGVVCRQYILRRSATTVTLLQLTFTSLFWIN